MAKLNIVDENNISDHAVTNNKLANNLLESLPLADELSKDDLFLLQKLSDGKIYKISKDILKAAFSSGGIGNIYYHSKQAETIIYNTEYVDIGLECLVNIKANSIAEISTHIPVAADNHDGTQAYFRILRNNQDITGNLPLVFDHDQGQAGSITSYMLMDLPDIGGTYTYKIQVKIANSNSKVKICYQNSKANLIIKELHTNIIYL